MEPDPLRYKSHEFALKVIHIARVIFREKREFDLGKQLLRSGTSIGAQIHEARYAISRADFRNKMSIALKEANESLYWLSLFKESEIINKQQYQDLAGLCNELIAMLIATVKKIQ